LLAAASHEDELRRLGIEPTAPGQRPALALSGTGERALTKADYKALAVDNLPILRQLLEG
jgi:hypothetical protein